MGEELQPLEKPYQTRGTNLTYPELRNVKVGHHFRMIQSSIGLSEHSTGPLL